MFTYALTDYDAIESFNMLLASNAPHSVWYHVEINVILCSDNMVRKGGQEAPESTWRWLY